MGPQNGGRYRQVVVRSGLIVHIWVTNIFSETRLKNLQFKRCSKTLSEIDLRITPLTSQNVRKWHHVLDTFSFQVITRLGVRSGTCVTSLMGWFEKAKHKSAVNFKRDAITQDNQISGLKGNVCLWRHFLWWWWYKKQNKVAWHTKKYFLGKDPKQ